MAGREHSGQARSRIRCSYLFQSSPTHEHGPLLAGRPSGVLQGIRIRSLDERSQRRRKVCNMRSKLEERLSSRPSLPVWGGGGVFVRFSPNPDRLCLALTCIQCSSLPVNGWLWPWSERHVADLWLFRSWTAWVCKILLMNGSVCDRKTIVEIITKCQCTSKWAAVFLEAIGCPCHNEPVVRHTGLCELLLLHAVSRYRSL